MSFKVKTRDGRRPPSLLANAASAAFEAPDMAYFGDSPRTPMALLRKLQGVCCRFRGVCGALPSPIQRRFAAARLMCGPTGRVYVHPTTNPRLARRHFAGRDHSARSAQSVAHLRFCSPQRDLRKQGADDRSAAGPGDCAKRSEKQREVEMRSGCAGGAAGGTTHADKGAPYRSSRRANRGTNDRAHPGVMRAARTTRFITRRPSTVDAIDRPRLDHRT